MPRGTSTFGRDEDLTNFISAQIRRVQEKEGLTIVEMSQVAGYDRASFHRMLRGDSLCNIEALYRLSVHYNLPMDYWFPPRQGAEEHVLPKVVVREGAIPSMLPLTRKMIRVLDELPTKSRKQLIILALRHPELIPDLTAMALAMAEAKPERRKRLVAAVKTIAKETCQPAP